jgi:hypothetical protein
MTYRHIHRQRRLALVFEETDGADAEDRYWWNCREEDGPPMAPSLDGFEKSGGGEAICA